MSLFKHVPHPDLTLIALILNFDLLVANKQSSDGLSSVDKPNKPAANSSRTNDRANFNNMPNKSSSLELILTPIIQSRR